MTVTLIRLAGTQDLPPLVVGPSLGTSASTLWGEAAQRLGDRFQVIGWDLPGHGTNHAPVDPGLTIADLARDLLAALDEALPRPDPVTFHYAGDSVGGAVGLQLALDAPQRLSGITLCCTGARLGSVESWQQRARTVTDSGTPALVSTLSRTWFGEGFVERHPDRASRLLHALSDTEDAGYTAVCHALELFDVRDRLAEVTTSVLAIAGEQDQPTPPAMLEAVVAEVQHGRLVVLPGTGHLAPAEQPDLVAALLAEHAQETGGSARTTDQVREAGMAVRREVLGDAHVDRAGAAVDEVTRDFQRFITEYAWGGIWTRPGLDRRSRSMVTLTALVAGGHLDELAMHVRAARRNGLTDAEISEVLLQTAVYCGVPAANSAFRVAQRVLAEEPDEQ